MNTELVAMKPAAATARRSRTLRRLRVVRAPEAIALRAASPADAPAIHALIDAHVTEGHLLPRSLDELRAHAPRFVIAVDHTTDRAGEMIVACAELAPLSSELAEVRSLVVHQSARARGIGRRLIDDLRRSAARAGFHRLCAFTHEPGYFVRQGFSIVPHEWVPEKIARDCSGCALFRSCGQHAVMLPLSA